MMTIVRFASPRLELAWDPPMLLRITLPARSSACCSWHSRRTACSAVAGIALWGIGSALGFPLGISALSVDPVMTPARVSVLSTVNYGAALIGPPLLGLIADHIGYHRALAFVALPVLLAIILAGQVPDRRGTKHTDLAFGD